MNDKREKEFHLKKSEIMIATDEFRKNACAFIEEGSLVIRELNFYGVSKSIPPDESAITSLVYGNNNRLYGGTSGEKAHLFYYDPFPSNDHVVHIGVVENEKEICNLVCDKQGRIYGGTSPNSLLFCYDPKDDYSLIWKYQCSPIDIIGSPAKGERIHALTIDKEREIIYGIILPNGELFSYNIKNNIHKIHHILNPKHLSHVLVYFDDAIYGAEQNGVIFRYLPSTDKIERLDFRIPCLKGMEFVNEWESAAILEAGVIYGGTLSGHIFSLDASKEKVISYGKPIREYHIRGLAINRDGIIYGIAGEKGKISHLFYFDPANGEMKDLGLAYVNFPKCWAGYELGSIAIGKNGEVYLGECDRISHLFIYYPPVKKRT